MKELEHRCGSCVAAPSQCVLCETRDEAAGLRNRVVVLEKALRDVRDLAGRERFVMLGPRAFVAAVRIVDAVLGEQGGK